MPAKHQAFLRAELAQSRAWGVDAREADIAELAERAGYYQPSGAEVAVWCPEDMYIEEPGALVTAYLSACRLHGVQILESEPATAVLISGGRVTGLETASRNITARTVVDAAGAWARQVGELARAWVPVAPVLGPGRILTRSIRPSDRCGSGGEGCLAVRPLLRSGWVAPWRPGSGSGGQYIRCALGPTV